MKKRFLLILILLSLRSLAPAQGALHFTAGNLVLNVDFSPLPGSPGTHQPSGTANYYYYPDSENDFSISISLGTNQASDGWILQKENDGSYMPVMELTDETTELDFLPPVIPGQFPSGPLVTQYGYSQDAELTAEQAQALVAGEWYAEVSYGDDEYIGNLSPAYIASVSPAIAISPDSVFPSPSVTVFPGGNATGAVISPGLRKPARVTLDGSNSLDAFYLPLQFRWRNGPGLVAGAATTTLSLMPGNYAFMLEVSDGYSTNSAMAMVDVLSPEDAIDDLTSAIAQTGLNHRTARGLTSTLEQAESSLERGDIVSGTQELATFRRDINSVAGQMDSATAFYLYDGAEDIIEAVGGQLNGR